MQEHTTYPVLRPAQAILLPLMSQICVVAGGSTGEGQCVNAFGAVGSNACLDGLDRQNLVVLAVRVHESFWAIAPRIHYANV
jgi:hypothetical protein